MNIDVLAASYLVEKLLDARLVRQPQINGTAAGANVKITVPTGVYWEILSLRMTFTASAIVANRRPSLVIRDPDGVEQYRIGTRVDVAAAGVATYNFIAALGYEDTAEPALYGLPIFPFPFSQGWTIETVTANLDVGDAYTLVRMSVREFAPDRIAEQVARLENDVAGLYGRFDFEADDDR